MKTFDQLTNSQKDDALDQAKRTIKELVKDGIINFGHGDELSDTTVGYYAQAAAEGSLYSEAGDRIIDGIVE